LLFRMAGLVYHGIGAGDGVRPDNDVITCYYNKKRDIPAGGACRLTRKVMLNT